MGATLYTNSVNIMNTPQPIIIYEDQSLVVVNKPAGMLTLPDRFEHKTQNLRRFLLERYGDIFTVHRLDRDTSGIIVFARHAEAHRNLSMQFEHHSVQKYYQAIVRGIFEKDEMDIDIPLAPDSSKKGLMRPSARGKQSFTQVKLLERFRIASLVECRPHTGRQHQIRVHLAAIGHPLLVDADYGSLSEFFVSSVKRKFKLAKNTEEQPLLKRIPLHARALEFVHPDSAQTIRFEAELPKDMNAVLNILRKYAPYQAYTSIAAIDEWL
jgi:23S rRNA pseudouridine955/2504/2580 synthase/23S rRNA pseudouridine1911/1915/1917 synthase